MGFHKYLFLTRMIEQYPNAVVAVTGWANEDYTIGFHKIMNGKAWAATDIFSGLRICKGKTRKECVEWVLNNKNRIEERMKEEEYQERVREFQFLLREV